MAGQAEIAKTELVTPENTAIMVDGAFFRLRAKQLLGYETPQERACRLFDYCRRHLKDPYTGIYNKLYRIYYYDCPPIETNLWHPLLQRPVAMKQAEDSVWMREFLRELAKKRKVALRLGEIEEKASCYRLKESSTKKLFRGDLTIDDVLESDFEADLVQKGVDMRIGLDIALLSYRRLVTQIILISGDSDFVPAAKLARREGIDFVLDPMWRKVKPKLQEHVDGMRTCLPKPQDDMTDS